MNQMTLPKKKTKKSNASDSTLDAASTYSVEGRTFIVQPVFQTEGDCTLAALLLNLMRADTFSK